MKILIKNNSMTVIYLAWFSSALFFFYQYMLRVAPNLMMDQLRAEFLIKAEEFSTLGSLYLLAYSLLQIPLGLIADKVGVKKMVLTSIIVCIVGSLLFASATNFQMLQISRFIIGAGSATAFMCALKIIADYFPPNKKALLMGTTLTFGTVGALVSGNILLYFIQQYGWRIAGYISSCAGVILFFIAIFSLKSLNIELKDDPSSASKFSFYKFLSTIVEILKDKNIMLYSILAVGLYTPLSALADLWGSAFLMQKFNLTHSQASSESLSLYLGLGVGSIILPSLCKRESVLENAILLCALSTLILFCIVLYAPAWQSNYYLTTTIVVIGFFCGAEMMCFTAALRHAPKNRTGEIIGVVNTLNMLGNALLQQLIGFLLDYRWHGAVDSKGIRQYSTSEFVFSLSSLTLVIGFCVIISLLSILPKLTKKRLHTSDE